MCMSCRYMKVLLFLTLLLTNGAFVIRSLDLQALDPTLIQNKDVVLSRNKAEDKIRHFRTFEEITKAQQKNPEISIVGAEGRYISGSGQFTTKNIALLRPAVQEIANTIDKIIIVDLRLESHLFINDVPYTWKSKNNRINLEINDIELDETDRLNSLLEKRVANIPSKDKESSEEEAVFIDSAFIERSVVEDHGFVYKRLPVLDHSRPKKEEVDAFISLMKENPNSWLHVHCFVGKGRTTTFMAIYDMYSNAQEIRAKNISFDDILLRQAAIGGEDLRKHEKKPSTNEYKQDLAVKRLDFLKKFFQYCEEANLEEQSWSDWPS